MNTTTEYRGYKIEPETDPWCLKYKKNFRYYNDPENIRHAETIEEAKELIDNEEN